MRIVSVPPRSHMRAREVVPTISLLERLYLATTDTSKYTARHCISQPNIRTEHAV